MYLYYVPPKPIQIFRALFGHPLKLWRNAATKNVKNADFREIIAYFLPEKTKNFDRMLKKSIKH